MIRLFKAVDALSTWVAKFAAISIFALMLTLTFEVVLRYGFNSPTAWSFDMSYFINSFVVMMGASYTLLRDSHVRVDLIYRNLPERARAGLNGGLMLVVFVPFMVLILHSMWPNLMNSWRSGEGSMVGTWRPPIYPFKAWIFVALCLFLLQGIVEGIRDVLIALRGRR
jgi:TRAP-type mannitol/chloroaromatic compound transport system permease small subunit